MQQQFNGGQITKETFVFRGRAQSKHIPHMLVSAYKSCSHAGEPAGWASEEGMWEAKQQHMQEENDKEGSGADQSRGQEEWG